MKKSRILLALAWALCWAGVGAWAGAAQVPVESIVLTAPDDAFVGRTLALLAEVLPANATDPSLTWSVDDETIATIDDDGVLTGVREGRVVVTASARDSSGVKGTLDVDVLPVKVESIAVVPGVKALAFGAEWPLDVVVEPADAVLPELIWQSSAPDVAAAWRDELGNMHLRAGYAPGSAMITATSAEDDAISAACEVRVMTPATDILINVPGNVQTILRGEQMTVSAEVLPSDASGEIAWSVSDPAIASIEENGSSATFTALQGGEVTLFASAQDGSRCAGEARLMVRVPIEGVGLPDAATVFVGREAPLTATLWPTDTTDRLLRFTSDDQSVATVDRNGNVRGVSVGQALIYARSAVDSDVVAVCVVDVVKPVTAIVLTASEHVIGVGGSVRVDVAVSPVDAADARVSFRSSNPAVASVDESGVVTAIADGETVIEAVAVDGGGAMGALPIEVQSTVTAIALAPAMALLPDEQVALILSVKPVGLNPGAIAWKSDAPHVATVDASGVVTGVSVGEALVTATAANGQSARCLIKVSPVLSAIELYDARGRALTTDVLEVDLGQTYQLTATARPAGIAARYTWASANPKVATVSESGAINAVKAGTAALTVTARAEDGGQPVKRLVTVKVIEPVTSVMLPEGVSVLAGSKHVVQAVLSPSKATYKRLTWATGDKRVATVDERGAVTGIAPGTTLLTATSHNRVVGISRVTVSEPVREIKITPSAEGHINPGDQLVLSARVLPSDADQSVTWRSGKNAIASISADGVVTAKRAGTVKLTATARDGSGATQAYTLRVVAPVKKLKLSKTTATIYTNGNTTKLNHRIQLKATITPKAASKRTVVWTSNDPSVAVVDANGRVVAKRDGLALVTASTENGCRDQATIWVKTLPTTLALDRDEVSLAAHGQVDLSGEATMDGSEDALTFKSSKPAVAKVSKAGVVTARKPGTAVITVKTRNGITAKCTITVTGNLPPADELPEAAAEASAESE